jgi:hypothetical protein
MNAPETTSKGRPSLLSQPAPGAPDNSFRILASLEGRVSAQRPARRRRLSKPLAAAALTVAGLSAIGAWQWHRAPDNPHPVLAAAAGSGAAAAISVSSAAAASSVAPSAQAAQSAQGTQAAASTPQAAVIVSDDSTAPANNDPLSRALANGAVPSANKPASAASVASASNPSAASSAALASVGQRAASKPAVAHTARESAKRRPSEKLAEARAGKRSKARAAQDDSDAEVLAPLVARTKPYDAQASGHAKGKTHPLTLAARVKECEKSNFFEEQVCRWRVCSNHWGKDPACPSASSASQTR